MYYATCITGLEEVAESALKKALPDVNVDRAGEGFILFETSATHDQLRSLRFFNNVFAVISWQEELSAHEPLKVLASAVRNDLEVGERLQGIVPKGGSFTVMASVANQPASIPHFVLEKLEKMLCAVGRFTVDRQDPRLTFWLLARREGFGFLGLRLTRGEPALPQGALRPELCHLLCLLSDPKPTDVFLDPFCGSGAIPLERTVFPAKEIWAGDTDIAKTKHHPSVRVTRMDALRLEQFENESIDVIVTDPPWGLFQPGTPDLRVMLDTFERVLKPEGRLVLLLGRAMELPPHPGLNVIAQHPILVSGKKAMVWRLAKRKKERVAS